MRFISEYITNDENILQIEHVQKINENDLLYKFDVFELDAIQNLFDSKGTPGIFLSDHVIHCENFNPKVKFIGLPLWLERERKYWKSEELSNQTHKTKYCFNFMINKKQVNRYLCIKLVELFGFKNFTYTWSGVDNYFDCTDLIVEHNSLGKSSPLTASQFGSILSPITIEPFFYFDEKQQDIQSNGSSRYDYGGNKNSWDWGCSRLFLDSAVSLITESLGYQKASAFTEKTLYSVLGLNFPIWIGGGNKQAEMWNKLGLDTFDDVINHDYQYYDTLLERCVYAFTLNKRILTDLEFAKSIRNSNLQRLEKNRSLIMSGILSNYIKKEIEKQFSDSDNVFKHAINGLLQKFKIDNCQLESP